MLLNKTVKIYYHFFTCVFLVYISSLIENMYIMYIKNILLLIALFHLYDTYWFIECINMIHVVNRITNTAIINVLRFRYKC